MIFLYRLGIFLFKIAANVASFFNPKASKFIKGREFLWESLYRIDRSSLLIWIHCSSLGEFEQGRPLIEKIKTQYPEYKILLTFFSPSGYEIRKNYLYADYVTYLPLDTPHNARKFLEIVKPDKVFFIKYEFWYFLLRELHRKGIETYLISGIFRKSQYFFQWYGKPFRKMLGWFQWIFVQETASYKLLSSYGFKRVLLSGDTRLDRVVQLAEEAKSIPVVKKFKGQHPLLVAGSTWKKDEDLLLNYYRQHETFFKMIVAPHKVEENNIERIIYNLKDYKVIRYSKAEGENVSGTDVLIIDCIGLLASLYRYGDFAYIGGGFGKGIHNLAEAATWNIPVVFGPNYKKFKEANDLIDVGGGFSIHDYHSLESIFNRFMNNPEFLSKAGKVAGKYIGQNAGATEQIMQNVFGN
ncbi:MAG: glycosyltransferase N-terminal domain-containing protein [Bacteroidales bacterium]